MYLVQHAWNWTVMECTAAEARFWAQFSEYNVYERCGCIPLIPQEII